MVIKVNLGAESKSWQKKLQCQIVHAQIFSESLTAAEASAHLVEKPYSNRAS